jgi:hypothetical protein
MDRSTLPVSHALAGPTHSSSVSCVCAMRCFVLHCLLSVSVLLPLCLGFHHSHHFHHFHLHMPATLRSRTHKSVAVLSASDDARDGDRRDTTEIAVDIDIDIDIDVERSLSVFEKVMLLARPGDGQMQNCEMHKAGTTR